jgi:hypothetical protein
LIRLDNLYLPHATVGAHGSAGCDFSESNERPTRQVNISTGTICAAGRYGEQLYSANNKLSVQDGEANSCLNCPNSPEKDILARFAKLNLGLGRQSNKTDCQPLTVRSVQLCSSRLFAGRCGDGRQTEKAPMQTVQVKQ